MNAEPGLPRYSVSELNQAIGSLLERGFAPRFLLEATVSRPQLKKGHLWLTLVDEQASVSAVVWASQLSKLSHQPSEGDGVTVVGKLNFWATRASLCVQVLDLRPSLSAVLRRFEQVRQQLEPEGLFAPEHKRSLPAMPEAIALLTSAPSSALADMLRTAAERWPATRIHVVPIPVQGPVEAAIQARLAQVIAAAPHLGIEAIVLARGGGSREDLAVFDSEELARDLATCPLPVVTGLGHEDDTTIADLVADYRAATPTAAIVALVPDRQAIQQRLAQERSLVKQVVILRLERERQRLSSLRERLDLQHPTLVLQRLRHDLQHRLALLQALSPEHLLQRGFALVRTATGELVRSAQQVTPGDALSIQLAEGQLEVEVKQHHPQQAG
ncbi:exodeoxyribonuclease VII large subunit [Synechococcus sp. HJ21-Hayes]|uniref:exodeoxyribonuclease VII large subunit n=1 Tax=unclassified Synechococcus TaxID=2626047 RepID=UPI0020CE3A02|nr:MULTISPECIES: exodeoxyribonuclease VII large subunit [unclassified Synechococcus]MCP9831769.1 exodeoxyribonuclease VII large subunit [Synechococcus sp. JJ3a-Johnson]MCP9853338.1 exodeoxyribonuclease VII large subunit [Synechococcus sp. HJ21-Hayes]